jgi:hypothetical protein
MEKNNIFIAATMVVRVAIQVVGSDDSANLQPSSVLEFGWNQFFMGTAGIAVKHVEAVESP